MLSLSHEKIYECSRLSATISGKVQNPSSVTEPNRSLELKSLIGKFVVVIDLRLSALLT